MVFTYQTDIYNQIREATETLGNKPVAVTLTPQEYEWLCDDMRNRGLLPANKRDVTTCCGISVIVRN